MPKQTLKKKSKAKKVEQTRTLPFGWNTTDEDEARRRRIRAETEPMKIIKFNHEIDYFDDYNVLSGSGKEYLVEVRSLALRINSCLCTDYDTNALGTCKHIEKVVLALKKKGKRKFEKAAKKGSSRIEIYVNPADDKIKILWPYGQDTNNKIYKLLNGFFFTDGTLIADDKTSIPVIRNLIKEEGDYTKNIRLSRRISSVIEINNDFSVKERAKELFLQDAELGKSSLDMMKLPLYDYQKQGMLHLAFMERAILADEMGLGKTVQAVAACELLKRQRNIRKVLVILPTSLKSEWEEQIAKFSNLSFITVYGNSKLRLHQYQQDSFFYLVNYEQTLRDYDYIQRFIAPDVIVLDEAQRIKNWQTKTAITIKNLYSTYAFVLTGTPIENRIDDIYSIMQFLNPRFFGSLFRFNREFYILDEKGKPIGYKNLDILHKKIKPVLLRRLKSDVEDQLPERTVNNYFVAMSQEQNDRYADYEQIVIRLAATAQKRPLTKDEFKSLQQSLASMRMLCDTPYILDESCRICPKLGELETILEELFQDKGTKVIIFSEWVRMLGLIAELLQHMKVKFAWHTGEVDQRKRREEINRFKNDEQCRVFLSTDSGSLGLNLQVANVVINVDLPWNPAKLEQRIARAWRKHQTKTVQIINLISQDTIEHRMIGLLDHKKSLADVALDSGKISEIMMPLGRASFMNNLNSIIGPIIAVNQPDNIKDKTKEEYIITQCRDEIVARFKPRLYKIDFYRNANGRQIILVVIDGDIAHPQQQIRNIMNRIEQDNNVELEVIDRVTYEMLQNLSSRGVLRLNQENAQNLYQSDYCITSDQDSEAEKKRLQEAREIFQKTDRKQNMASILIENGFYDESIAPLQQILELSLKSLAIFLGYEVENDQNVSLEVLKKIISDMKLPEDTDNLAKTLQNLSNEPDKLIDQETATNLLVSVQTIHTIIKELLDKSAADLRSELLNCLK